MKIPSHRKANPSSARAHGATGLRPWWAPGLLVAALGSAYAQGTPTPAAPPGSAAAPASPTAEGKEEASAQADGGLQTVTVSATRRRELVREVPLAISTISPERLTETGAKSLRDYLATQPGVALQDTVLDGAGGLVIRGLTVGLDVRASAAIYVDDVPIGPSASTGLPLFDMTLLDLGRIEVLRGPQGTLYGTSSMGGLLKYVTNEPDAGGLSGKLGLGLSSTRNGGLNRVATGAVNVPLQQDTAAMRVAVFDSHDAGYVDATGAAAGSQVNSRDRSGARVSLLLTPGRNLSIKLTAMEQRTRKQGNDTITYNLATGAPVAGDLVYANRGSAENEASDISLYSLTLDYNLGWARLSSITSTQEYSIKARADASIALRGFGLPSGYADAENRMSKDTQEFRLLSQVGGTFDWLVGAFYVKEKLTSQQTIVAVPIGVLADAKGSGTYKETAVYGNVTWNLSPDLGLTAGLRKSRNASGPPDATDSPTTYLLTAKYRLSPQSNVYFRAASGYRAGGANAIPVNPATGLPVPDVPPKFLSDTVWSYEAGYKASFPNAKAGLEAALFEVEWKDLQQYKFIPLASFLTNSGRARIRGAELAGSIEAVAGLTLSASATALDAALLDASAALQASAGSRLPASPRFAANAAARYRFLMAGMPAFAAATLNHVGTRNSGFVGAVSQPNFVLPAFTQLDLSGGISLGKAEVGIFVRNASDRRGLASAYTLQPAATGAPALVRVIEPRTFGLNASWSF